MNTLNKNISLYFISILSIVILKLTSQQNSDSLGAAFSRKIRLHLKSSPKKVWVQWEWIHSDQFQGGICARKYPIDLVVGFLRGGVQGEGVTGELWGLLGKIGEP